MSHNVIKNYVRIDWFGIYAVSSNIHSVARMSFVWIHSSPRILIKIAMPLYWNKGMPFSDVNGIVIVRRRHIFHVVITEVIKYVIMPVVSIRPIEVSLILYRDTDGNTISMRSK